MSVRHLWREMSHPGSTLLQEQKIASHPDGKSSPTVQESMYLQACIGCGLFYH